MNSYTSPSTKPLYKATLLVWYIVGLIEAVLMFRFLLKLFEANPTAGFSQLIYSISGFFTAPFSTVFNVSAVTGSTFEWTTLLAMLVYLLVGYAIVNLLLISRTVSSREAVVGLRDQEN